MRDLATFVGIGGGGPVLVGAPEQLVDKLMEWIDVGVDGFNLAYAITPGMFADFIDGVGVQFEPVWQQLSYSGRKSSAMARATIVFE